MPIPTRSQSVKGTAPPGRGSSQTRPHPQAGNKIDDAADRATTAAPRGASSLPQPNKKMVTGLPQVVTGHARAQSASLATLSRESATTRATANGLPLPKPGPRTKSTLKAHSRAASGGLRFGHTPSQSSVAALNIKPQTGIKPPFNNHQQQFGPPNPRSDAHAAIKETSGASVSSADGPSPRLSRLQDELLQLTLVRERSQNTLKQYTESAKSTLGARASRLWKDEADVAILEQKQQEDINNLALLHWVGRQDMASGLGQVQSLSLCVRELSDLSSETGTFTRIMNDFDTWQTQARGIQENQTYHRNTTTDSSEAVLVHAMDPAWQQALLALEAQLMRCQHTLGEDMGIDERSGLGLIVAGHHQLVGTMLEQLQLCSNIHSSVLKDQQCHIRETLAKAVSEAQAGDQEAGSHRHKPMWEILQPG